MTEVQPLAERGFYRRKPLVPPDVPENYMEVTAKFKADWEAADHSEPPQSFIDQWNSAAGKYGRYNPETRLFELNGLTDITYSEALKIAARPLGNESSFSGFYSFTDIRTNLCLRTMPFGTVSCQNMCNSAKLEVLRVPDGFAPSVTDAMLANCPNLREVIGYIKCPANAVFTFTANCPIQEIRLRDLRNNINLSNLGKISIESLRYMVEYAINTTPLVLPVHKNVYAKLTGDTSNAAAAALSEEELATWSALLDLAFEQQITFSTT